MGQGGGRRTVTWIEGNLKVKDTFREAHPQERAHTRNPQGKKALTDAKRRIDQIWVSNPAASSPHMRAGIPKEPRHGLGSDHRPMITDIGIYRLCGHGRWYSTTVGPTHSNYIEA